MELKSESGEFLGFSSAFLLGLEVWSNTPDVKEMISRLTRNERFFTLREAITKADLSRNEILLETLCATITMYITHQENPDPGIAANIMVPLAA